MTARRLPAVVATVIVGGLVALAVAGPAGATFAPTTDKGPVIVVAVPGLRWTDLDTTTTPRLWRLAGESALGSLSVRGGRPRTCPVDGFLILGSGNRARAVDTHANGCLGDDPGVPVRVEGGHASVDLAVAQANNDRTHFGTKLGALGSSVAGAGGCTTAVGRGAVPAAATKDGIVDSYVPLGHLDRGGLARCDVTIVDVDDLLPGTTPGALKSADAAVGRVVDLAPASATVVVIGLSEVDHTRSHLHVVMIRGSAFPAGDALRSGTTRRAPFVQLIDVAPTVLKVLGISRPSSMVGEPARSVAGPGGDLRDRIDGLIDTDRAAIGVSRLVPPFFAVVVATQFALYVVAGAALQWSSMSDRWRRRIRRGARVAAVVYAGAPVATYLANLYPWWRADHPLVAVLLAELVGVVAIGVVAYAGPWRRRPLGPPGFVAAATALILAGDILTGGRLQLSSLLGYSPIVAGRFAGFGNVAFALFGTGAVLAAAAFFGDASRRVASYGIVLIGVAAVIVDGAPWFGADFGGVIALVPAFAVLWMLVVRGRVSWVRLIVAGVAAVVAVLGLALIDYARPAQDRTHLGRFIAQIRDGTAGDVIHRKADANLHLLTHSVLGLMVPITVLFLALVLRRPTGGLLIAFRRLPALRSGLLAVLVLGIIGFAVNDSGIAIPALAMTVAIPVAIAATVSAVEEEAAAGSPGPPSGASG